MNLFSKTVFATPAQRNFYWKARREATGQAQPWQQIPRLSCPRCSHQAPRTDWNKTLYICPRCGHNLPVGAHYRLNLVLDRGSFKELHGKPGDKTVSQKPALTEGTVTALGRIDCLPVAAAVLDMRFLSGSIGTAVAEKITAAVEYAAAKKLPFVLFVSGGMPAAQGLNILLQTAKIKTALTDFCSQGGLFISFLAHPAAAETAPDFAFLGDIILAEPNIPDSSSGTPKASTALQDKIYADCVVPRTEMRTTLAKLLKLHCAGGKLP